MAASTRIAGVRASSVLQRSGREEDHIFIPNEVAALLFHLCQPLSAAHESLVRPLTAWKLARTPPCRLLPSADRLLAAGGCDDALQTRECVGSDKAEQGSGPCEFGPQYTGFKCLKEERHFHGVPHMARSEQCDAAIDAGHTADAAAAADSTPPLPPAMCTPVCLAWCTLLELDLKAEKQDA